jgi:hypothetical protein
MRKQWKGTRKKLDAIVFLYSEGLNSTQIQKQLKIPSSSYWRILADGGGMPIWARMDHFRKLGKI